MQNKKNWACVSSTNCKYLSHKFVLLLVITLTLQIGITYYIQTFTLYKLLSSACLPFLSLSMSYVGYCE